MPLKHVHGLSEVRNLNLLISPCSPQELIQMLTEESKKLMDTQNPSDSLAGVVSRRAGGGRGDVQGGDGDV